MLNTCFSLLIYLKYFFFPLSSPSLTAFLDPCHESLKSIITVYLPEKAEDGLGSHKLHREVKRAKTWLWQLSRGKKRWLGEQLLLGKMI